MSTPKFKVGDKVRATKENQQHFSQLGNKIWTIERLGCENLVHLAGNPDPIGWCDYRFELVEPASERSEEYLQSLVNKANECLAAVYELDKIAPDRFEVNYPKLGGWKLRSTYNQTTNMHKPTEYRLTPPKPRERKFRLQDWDCVITADTVTVGCQKFPFDKFKINLSAVSREYCLESGDFRAFRKGISYQGHTLTWENADKLLAELEAFERENA